MGYTHRFSEKGGGAVCTYDAKSVVYKVPCNVLGVDSRKAFKLEFKWSDNRQSDDVMDFYVNGDAAPRGRLNWLFEFARRLGGEICYNTRHETDSDRQLRLRTPD